jgi:acyl-CoA thioesterase
MTTRFDTDTIGARLDAAWNIGDKPNGGYVMAASARSLWAGLPADQRQHPHPVTVTTHYLRPCDVGVFDHSADVLRTGRTFSTVQGSLIQDGEVRVHTLATFGDLNANRGISKEFGVPPQLPDPSECIERVESSETPPNSSLYEVIETRMHPDTGWLKGQPTGVPRLSGWTRLRDGRDPDPWSLLFFADAFAPTMFELLPERAWVPTIELTVHVRALPVSGWLRASFTTNHIINGRFEEDGELWDEAGTLVAQSRQLAMVLTPPA